MSYNSNYVKNNQQATKAHDEIMMQVERAIRTSEAFNHESELFDGLHIYTEPARAGGDILIYKAKKNDIPHKCPVTGRIFYHHSLSPFGKPVEHRPHYICPIEIKTTTLDLEKVALEGYWQSKKCDPRTEHRWSHHVSIAVKLKNFSTDELWPHHADIIEAVCLVSEADGDLYEMWRCNTLSSLFEKASTLVPDLLDGRLGRRFYPNADKIDTSFNQATGWRDIAFQTIYHSCFRAKTISGTAAEILDLMIRHDVLNPSKLSPKKSVRQWARDFGFSQQTFKNHIEVLQDAELLTVRSTHEGRREFFEFSLGLNLEDVI